MPDTGALPASVLTDVQERFLDAFFRDTTSLEPFYLSGGTALSAYYLQHRYSDDLDFFTRDAGALQSTDDRVSQARIETGLEIQDVVRRTHGVQYFFSGDPHPQHPLRKVEFMFDTPPHFSPPRLFRSVRVDDILCIAVNKLTALGRFEPKDYVDLYVVLHSGKYRLEDLIPLAREKDPGINELGIAADFQRVRELPHLSEFQRRYMIVQIDWDELMGFYQEWAARLFSLFPPPGEQK